MLNDGKYRIWPRLPLDGENRDDCRVLYDRRLSHGHDRAMEDTQTTRSRQIVYLKAGFDENDIAGLYAVLDEQLAAFK